MNNWEKEFDKRWHYSDVEYWDDIKSFIEKLLSKQREEILGKVKKFNTKNHICRFNDGESNCECYNQALSDIEKEI